MRDVVEKDLVEKIAETVLYEGYLLFPYRRSAMKNQARWTFGGVYPRPYSEATGGDDPWLMQTQCLVVGDADTEIEIKVRFLHVADRRVVQQGDGAMRPVDSLRVGELVHRPWEEALEREVSTRCRLGALAHGERRMEIAVPQGQSEELLREPSGSTVGALIREWQPVQGEVIITAEALGEQGHRLTVRIANTAPWSGEDRNAVLRRTLVSTHTILRVSGGEFVSLLEPAAAYQEAAAQCENIKTWPVLVGEPGERHTLLSSPIILYDYPQVSPETPGDLFDGTEIDELLRFSILTLTDEEKQEMRESDARGRAILERTEAMTPDELMQLHGVVRNLQFVREDGP